jgi:CPA2 family monovalent cation:H+ antiporter-2
MLVATFRKLQALGLLVAETKVTQVAAGESTPAIRSLVAQVVPIAGALVMALFVLALSATLLPSLEVFAVLLGLVALITWLLWRSSVRVYSKAQSAIRETFAQQPDPLPQAATRGLHSLLKEANLATVTITADSQSAGKLIAEVQLRTRTGASIVGIERNGESITNPGPDEELQSGDKVLLLGTPDQLGLAKIALSKS